MSTLSNQLAGVIVLLAFTTGCGSNDPVATQNLPTDIPDSTPTLQVATPTEVPDISSMTMAFTSERDGNMEIYLMRADGNGLHRLTDDPAEDYWPSWSPDGSQIAFASDRNGDFEIYLINVEEALQDAAGSPPQQLTQEAGNDLEPAWSPDGTKIAFMVYQDGKSDIYTMNPDGSQRQKLTDSNGDNYLPKWSPDSTQIVFVSERDENPEIYIMNADGSGQRRLTNNPTDDRYPSWSPDGVYITFYSDRDGDRELYMMKVNDNNPQPLTHDDASVWVSDWSPDGRKIAFTSNRDGNREIYVMDSDGSNLQRLTNNTVLDGIPTWRPVNLETGALNVTRSLLIFNDLVNGFDFASPVDEASLTFPSKALSPSNIFEGRLELQGEDQAGEMTVLRGDPDLEPEVTHLPEFDFEFVQHQGYLIPVQRGLIITNHPFWNYILEPGRVWQENGDQGFSRASLPFALVWKGSNATLNGTMTFLFSDEEISKVWYQVTQETTISLSADMWGLLEGSYHPGPVMDANKIKDAFAQELVYRFPTRPIEQLAIDYPDVNTAVFGSGVSPKNMTWYGFVINGINYVSGCQTRYGEYPYCEYMRVPSYSTAKSAFVSVAMMRLAQKFDPNIPKLLIQDYVPETANSPGDWSAVTFDHVLDMATGNYQSAGNMVDEEQWDNPFWNEEYYREVIAAAFDWPNSESPGTQWVYRTSDTFIVTRALQNYLSDLEGPKADIFDFVVDEVYKPLHMGPGVYSVLRTRDNNWQGQPYGGLGMWWIPDDLAKISNFLNADHGAVNGEQILDPMILAAALQRDPNDRGVNWGRSGKYNNAFWADPYEAGYDCKFWVPQMLGYSGIVVVLMPNGANYYYASDGREFNWNAVVREVDKILPFCP